MSTWTDERMETLKAMLAKGRSASEIAIELDGGITRNAVIGKAHRLGLAKDVRHVVVKSTPPPAPREPRRQQPSLPVVTLAPEADAVVTLLVVMPQAPTEPMGEGVSIHGLDAAFQMCRWIVRSDPLRRGGDRYCGEKAVAGCSWCAWHRTLVYTRPDSVPAAAKVDRIAKPSTGDLAFGAFA